MRMTPNRRQFVASLATLPLAGMPLVVASASAQQPRAAPDPVLQQILSDLRALVAEGEAQPAGRKGVTRAIETTLAIEAAHLAAHYDPQLVGALRRREAKVGRAALVDEIVSFARTRKDHDYAASDVEEAIARFAQGGFARGLRDVQRAMGAVRRSAPDGIQRATTRETQFDYCADLSAQIAWTTFYSDIICAIAIIEPSPVGEAACAASMLTNGFLNAAYWWWCR
jgi:hypothetical protein